MITTENNIPGRLIGISGTNGAGKDTAAQFLVGRGYMHVSTGDILRAEATERGLDHERSTLIELAKTLGQEQNNPHALVAMGIEAWHNNRAEYLGGLVMSGLRILGEAEEFKRRGGQLLFIDAPVEERYRRIQGRGRGAEAGRSLEEFAAHDRIEYQGLGGPQWPNLQAIKDMSDFVIVNDKTEADFTAQLRQRLFAILS